ncbi:MAG: CCA tRNA nucleotidyltransferase [Desulfonatronovibrio sp.]
MGGAVRDFIMQRPVKDVDLITDMPRDRIVSLFKTYNIGKGKEFGLLSIIYKQSHFDVVSITPDCVEFGEQADQNEKKQLMFLSDARQRDFTINAMAMDGQGLILDPLGGRRDIKKKMVRTSDDPEAIFLADPLRMIRAVRFAAGFDFNVDPAALDSISRLAPRIHQAAVERISRELVMLASFPGRKFARGLEIMEETGLLEQLLPEISSLRKFEHDPVCHPEGGVLEHVLAALRANVQPDPEINLCILFHDAGKAATLEMKDSRPVYHRHDKAGQVIVSKAGQRLRLPRRFIETMCFAARNHMKAQAISRMRPSRVFALMSEPGWPVLKEVVRCDLLARSEEKAGRFEQDALAASRKINKWLDQKRARPVVSGREVMEYTGLEQGPAIGEILKKVSSWALDNNITDPDKIREYILSLQETLGYK